MRTVGALGVLAALLLAACGSPPPPAAPTGLTGDWNGTIELPGQPLRFGARFAPDGTGAVDIPAQGATGLAVTGVTITGTEVRFGLALPGDPTFTGTVAPDGESVAGTFTQGGQELPFTMTRGPLAGSARPQEPKPPFPYRSTDVTFPSGAITVAGTLTQPDGPGPFPAVVLITGSGAQDRDETIEGHKPFLLLADTLTRAGFAVLRTDDRGVGGTGGDLLQSTYPDLAADVQAALAFLRARPDIDPQRLGLLGHSEGGYLAPLVAQGSPEVRFVIMMAGPAVPGLDVLLEQNELIYAQRGAPRPIIDAQLAFVRDLAALLRAGDVDGARARTRQAIVAELDAAGTPQDRRPTPEQIEQQAAAVTAPVFAAFLAHDPTPSLRALDVPVLAFYGDKDLQVPPAQSEPAVRAALAGNPDATIRTFPGLNHLMQPTTSGAVDEYGVIETTIDPQVLELVRSWAVARFVR